MSFLISAAISRLRQYYVTDIQPTKHHHRLTNLHHFAQLCQIASDEVKESKLVKVLGPLIAHFHNLVVALEQRSFAKAFPAAALIQRLCSFQSYLQVQDRGSVTFLCSGSGKSKHNKRIPVPKHIRIVIRYERRLYLNITTLQGQTKACLLIFDKVQSHLRIALLLQVGNDRLPHQLGITNHVKHLARQWGCRFEGL